MGDISTVWLHATMMQLTLVFWTPAGELSVTYARRLLPSFEACSMTAHTKNWVQLSIKKSNYLWATWLHKQLGSVDHSTVVGGSWSWQASCVES